MPNILGIIEFISKLRSEIRMDMTTSLDAIDLKILRLLQEDARLTTKELAGRVNLSTTPVFERLKRLERDCPPPMRSSGR